jgi:diacylglycerol kinase
LFLEEHNARIHAIAAFAVFSAAIMLDISVYEWIALVIAIGLVFITEILNTSIENLGDFLTNDKLAVMKKIKDLSAAAVLTSVIVSIIIGLIIFLPKLI